MLILEDGTGKSDAQSYASVETLRAYAKARGATVPGKESECEVLLLKAMDAMHGLNYIGDRVSRDQALDWPRYNVCIEGFPYAASELPRQLEQAQCALAIEAQTVDLLPTLEANTSGPVTSETIGEISISYANNIDRVRNVPAVAKANVLLRLLLKRSGLQVVRT